jgi:hypothetical protein
MWVQHSVADEPDTDKADAYEVVQCAACTRVHFLHRKTGKRLGEK